MKSIIKIGDELIRLEQAALSHRNAAEEMKKEFFDNNENVINGSALFDQMSLYEWKPWLKRNLWRLLWTALQMKETIKY